MTFAVNERVKYRHNWYKVEALGNNGYIEAWDEKRMRKVYNSDIKDGLYKQIRGGKSWIKKRFVDVLTI